MSKKPKRRNKPYTGADAKHQTPVVHHYKAVLRSPASQWWYDHKRTTKIIAGAGAAILIVGWLLAEIVHLVFWGSVF